MEPSETTGSSQLESRIHTIRGERVMLDADLAELYGVTTANLNKAVKRNVERFPADFSFQLTEAEAKSLLFQTGIPKLEKRGGRRTLPHAFTEQGVAMLSSVLRSKRAVAVNIEIMRAFVRLRGVIATHCGLAKRLEELEQKYDGQFRVVFDAIRRMMAPEGGGERKRIGF